MIYIIAIGAFQSLLLVMLMIFNNKKKSTDVLLISLLACIFLHLFLKFVIYSDTHDTIFKKEFNNFIDLAYGPLLWMIAKKVKNHRYNFMSHWYLFIPAAFFAICYFAIIFYTFFYKVNPVPYIHLYNTATKFILMPMLLIFSLRAYYISTHLKDFWQTERQVITSISILFSIVAIIFAIYNTYNSFHTELLFPTIYLRVLFYGVLVLVCIAILRYFIISISEKNQIESAYQLKQDYQEFEKNNLLHSESESIHLKNEFDNEETEMLHSFLPTTPGIINNEIAKEEIQETETMTLVAPKKFVLSNAQCERILQKLEKIMTEQQLFAEPDLNLNRLAEISKISRYHISEALNKYAEKSFYTYINEYRIKNVLAILEKCKSMDIRPNILPIAFEAGFNSKSSFNLYFKKYTGLTPSEYINKHV